MESAEILEAKIKTLEYELAKKEKIMQVLMDRTEKSINSSGNAYTLFESNILLHEKIEERTAILKKINSDLLKEIETRKKVEKEKEDLINELQTALEEVKVLSGLLPICSFCKKIRDDKGYWQAIETYLQKHSGAEFSHGICNDCLKKYYPDIYNSKGFNKKE